MNHYETLGLPENANAAMIADAYRKMARKHHPDTGGDANSFKEIQRAYEVLSDPGSRERYDRCGDEGEHGETINRVISLVGSMVAQAFEQELEDGIEWMRKALSHAKYKLENAISVNRKLVSKIDRKLEKFKDENKDQESSDAFDVIAGSLNNRINQLNGEMGFHKGEIEITEAAISFIEGLKFKPESNVQQNSCGSMGITPEAIREAMEAAHMYR